MWIIFFKFINHNKHRDIAHAIDRMQLQYEHCSAHAACTICSRIAPWHTDSEPITDIITEP